VELFRTFSNSRSASAWTAAYGAISEQVIESAGLAAAKV